MPDKKLTDKEIVKALECCKFDGDCLACPMNHYKDGICSNEMLKSALDLINRQKAEIERLNFVRTRDAQQYNEKISDQAHTNCLLYDMYDKAIKEVKELEEKLKTAETEIERLKAKQEKCFYCTEQANKKISEIKAEAYKEFADRLKNESYERIDLTAYVEVSDIDNLLKEMGG